MVLPFCAIHREQDGRVDDVCMDVPEVPEKTTANVCSTSRKCNVLDRGLFSVIYQEERWLPFLQMFTLNFLFEPAWPEWCDP